MVWIKIPSSCGFVGDPRPFLIRPTGDIIESLLSIADGGRFCFREPHSQAFGFHTIRLKNFPVNPEVALRTIGQLQKLRLDEHLLAREVDQNKDIADILKRFCGSTNHHEISFWENRGGARGADQFGNQTGYTPHGCKIEFEDLHFEWRKSAGNFVANQINLAPRNFFKQFESLRRQHRLHAGFPLANIKIQRDAGFFV